MCIQTRLLLHIQIHLLTYEKLPPPPVRWRTFVIGYRLDCTIQFATKLLDNKNYRELVVQKQ